MKKGDFVVIGSVCVAAAITSFALHLFSSPSLTVTVSQNNKIVYEGKIDKDKQIELENNTVVIKNGEVFMKEASCKNQICVKHKKISKSGESIVCLPNRVTVETK